MQSHQFSTANIVPDHPVRQAHDPRTRQRSLPLRFEVIGLKHTVAILQQVVPQDFAPSQGTLAAALVDQSMVFQLIQRVESTVARQVIRGRTHHVGLLGQLGADERAVWKVAKADGQIQPLRGRIGDLSVGYGGSGSLSILDGGLVSNGFGIIANGGGTASATVSGVDVHGNVSTWINNSTLIVGSEGTGSLLIENGGLVRSVQGAIGGNTGAVPGFSSGTVVVSGSDGNGHASTWALGNNLYVGF